MAINFHFNGRSSAEFPIIVESREGSLLPSTSLKTLDVPGKPGAYFVGRDQGVRVEKIQIAARVRGNRALEELREQLAIWLDTSGPVPFFYDYRPERIYQAALSGETDITKIIFGKVELTFVMPDPFAESNQERSKGITSPPVIFDRQSTAYLPSGDQPIFPNEPRYLPGKFGQGILIEEGTTNLLSTPENPTQEEVNAKQGETHTLSHDMGSVEVAHVREEDLTTGELHNVSIKDGKLVLDRYGEDLAEDLPGWSGSHNQTRYDPDRDMVILDIESEEDTELTISQKEEEWEGGQNDGVAVGKDGNIIISDFPQWDYIDPMTDFKGTGWDPRINPDKVKQTAKTAQMISYIGEGTSVALVKEMPGEKSIRTVEFLYRLIPPSGSGYDDTEEVRTRFMWIFDQKAPGSSNFVAFRPFIFQASNLSGVYPGYAWIRMVVTQIPTASEPGNIDVYVNGEYDRSLPASSSNLTPRFQFILEDEDQGHFNLSTFKFSRKVLTPTQPSFQFPHEAYRISPYYDLSDLGTYRESTVTQLWERNDSLPAGSESYQHQAVLEVGVDHPVTGWTGYQLVSPGGGIPQLKTGDNLSGMSVRFRSTLRSFDFYLSPVLSDVRATIKGQKKTIYKEGIWTTDPIPLDRVGKATGGRLFFDRDTFFGTRVIPEATLEVGEEPGDWVQLEESGEERGSYEIPFLRPDTDLSDATLQIRFRLESEYGSSPGVRNVRVEIGSAYYAEGYRISPTDDLSGIGTALGSETKQSGETPEGTRIIYEAQLDGGDWLEITGDTIPQIQENTDLTGATFRTRQRLMSNSEGTVTPAADRYRWVIHQDLSRNLNSELENALRIIPATGYLLLNPHGVQRWQLEQKPYPTTFHPDERKPEKLFFPASAAVNQSEGTVSLWAFENGMDTLRHLFDTEGVKDRFALWRAGGNYYLRMNGRNVATVAADKIGWRWFAVRWDRDKAAFFIDGKKEWEGTLSEPFNYDSDWFCIGSDWGGGSQWNERLDEFHASKIARSDEDLSALDQPVEIDDHTTYLLRFDDSLSDVSAVVVNEGTAPTLPRIVVSVEKDLKELKILHIQSGQFLLLQDESSDDPLLRPGDTVELGRPLRPVLINGHDRKRFLTLDSDFFELADGENTFEVTEGAQAVAYWKERYK